MTKKYKLTHHTKVVDGHILHQVKALKSFGNVKKGELGGWIESYHNLSQSGTAWVYDDAKVYDNAQVCDDAKVYDDVQVFGDAYVFGEVIVVLDLHIGGEAVVN